MVIQRIQSVYLLLAAILMVLVNFVPSVAVVPASDPADQVAVVVADFIPLLVLNAITAVLVLVDIFLYKNLPLQMKVARISTVLIVASALIEAYVLSTLQGVEVKWIGSAIVILAALAGVILALKGMQKDYNTLRSYDRLR